jgi:hypothetical protein
MKNATAYNPVVQRRGVEKRIYYCSYVYASLRIDTIIYSFGHAAYRWL